MFEKGQIVKCIKNDNFERLLTINKNYYVESINNDKMNVKMGLNIIENIPIDYFILNEYNFHEDRDIIADIRLIDDIYNQNLENQISEVNYIFSYWSFKKNDVLKQLSVLETGYTIWYNETVDSLLEELTKNITDPKIKKDILSKYSTQAKEERLVIKFKKDEYKKWKEDIRNTEKLLNDYTTIVKAIEMKSLNLNVLNKNKLAELMNYKV